MPPALPAGFELVDDAQPVAASAPKLPAGFELVPDPQPADVPLPPSRPGDLPQIPTPPRRPDDINALPDNAQPAVGPMPTPRPVDLGSINDGPTWPTEQTRTYAGILDKVLGNAGKLTPERGQAEHDADVANTRSALSVAQQDAAKARAAAPAIDAAQTPGFDAGFGVPIPSGSELADQADQGVSTLKSALVDQTAAPNPQLTPARAAADQFVNAAGKAITGAFGPVGKAQRDFVDKPETQQSIDATNKWLDTSFPGDPGRANETSTKLAGAAGGIAPLLLLAAWSAPAAAAFSAMGGANSAYERTEAAQAEGKTGILGGNPLIDRWLSAVGGGAIGTAQMLPFSRLLGRMETIAPGSITGAVAQAAKSGGQTSVEQVLVQGLSTLGDNGIHKLLADKDQSLLEGVKESAEVAAIVGAALGIGGASYASAAARKALADRVQAATPAEIDAFLGKAKGMQSRADIDEFLKTKAAADAAKDAASAPALPAPGGDQPAPAPNATPAPAEGKSAGDQPPAPAPLTDVNSQAPATYQGGKINTPQPGDATLKAMGYGDDEIALMSPRERAQELASAKQAGIDVPDEGAKGTPTPAASGASTDTPETGTRAAPVKVETSADLAPARAAVDPDPTPAQIAAGNYKLGHVDFDGLPISIENPKGSTRSGTDPDGAPWSVTLPADYGYVKGTRGADGDHVDIYLGPKPPNGKVFVVDQVDPKTGAFDEHKLVAGVDSAGEAARIYNQGFSDGSGMSRIGGITEVPTSDLKTWLAKGEQKAPIAEPPKVAPPPGFELATPSAWTDPAAINAAATVDLNVNKPVPPDGFQIADEPAAPAAPPKQKKSEKPKAPQTLVSFLRAAGGIKDHRGELRSRDMHRRHPGLVNNKKGLALDHAREIAEEAGYLGHDRDRAHSETAIDDLLDAIDRHPTYSAFDDHQLQEWQASEGAKAQREHDLGHAEDAIHADLVDAGIPPHLIETEHLQAAARLVVDHGMPVQDAYDHAVMSAIHSEPAAGTPELHDDIPWDEYEAPETAPATADEGRQEDQAGSDVHGEEGARDRDKVGEEGRGGEEPEGSRAPESARAKHARGDETQSASRTESGAESRPQFVIPGAEKIGNRELAQRKSDEGLKPKVPQKDADGLALFNDSSKQADLLDMPKGTGPQARVGNGPAGRVEITPEMEKAVDDALMAAGIARRVAGQHASSVKVAHDIGLNREALRASGDENGTPIGLFDPTTKAILIKIATGEEASVAHHEAFHALDNADVFHPLERAVLNRETPRLRDQVAREYGVSPENLKHMPDFEIRAYAYEKYARDREAGDPNAGAGLHIGIRRIFDKVMGFMRRLRNMLHGSGFRTAEDVFETARTGEAAERPAGEFDGIHYDHRPQYRVKKNSGERRYFEDPSFLDRMKRRLGGLIDKDKFAENFLDLSAPVKQMQDLIGERAGAPIEAGRDLYKAKRLYPGKVAARSQDFETDYVKPLAAEAKDSGLTRQDISEYLFARHAPERNAAIDDVNPDSKSAGSGITNDQAQAILDRFARQGKLDALNKIEPKVRAIREFEIDTLNEAGLLSDAQAKSWRDKFENYVPLRGWEDEALAPDDAYFGEAKKLAVAGKETKQALGRSTIADDPLSNLVHQAYRAIDRAERNTALKAAWRLFKSMPADDLKDIAQLDKGKTVRTVDPQSGMVSFGEEPMWRFKANAVPLKIGGTPHYIVFEDPHLAESVKRLQPDQLVAALRPIGSFINFAKSMWTHYSPDFVFRHFFMRYPIEAALNAGEDGLGAMLRSAKGYPGGPAMRAVFAADHMTAVERASLANKVLGGQGTEAEKWQHYYLEMRDAGALMKFADFAGVGAIKKKLDATLSRRDQNPIKAAMATARAAHHWVDHITNALDNAQRLAAYVEARKSGLAPADAAMKAREATIDFALRGRYSRYVNLIWPFGNTAGQTAARAIKAVKRSSNMRKVVAGVVALGVANALYNYLFAGNDKDGTPFFEKVAEWTRRLHMVAMTPFKDSEGRPYYATISLPYNYAFPFTVGTAIAQLALKEAGIAKESVGSILHNVMHSGLEALTPMAQENSLLGKFMPEIGRPFLHVATNQNFAGSPLYRKDPVKGIAVSEQGNRNTPEHWKTLAKAVNHATGGTRFESGAVDLPPEAYKEVLGYTTDTIERLAVRAGHAISDVKSGKAPNVGDVPVVRAAVGGDKSYDQADRAAYYEARQKAYGAEASYKKASKVDPEAARRIAKEQAIEIGNARMFHAADQQRGGLYKQMDALNGNHALSSEDHDTKAKALQDRELAVMNRTRAMAERRQAGH